MERENYLGEGGEELYQDALSFEYFLSFLCKLHFTHRYFPPRRTAKGVDTVAHNPVSEGAADDLVSEADADESYAGLLEDEGLDEGDQAFNPGEVFEGALACMLD